MGMCVCTEASAADEPQKALAEKNSQWVRREDHLVPYPASHTVPERVLGEKQKKDLANRVSLSLTYPP